MSTLSGAVWNIISQTPWWVYLLFFYLFSIGIRASKTNIVHLYKLFFIPLVFVFFSIHTLVSTVTIDIFTLTTWFCAILIGSVLGWFQLSKYKLIIDKKNKLIQMPGTWTTLIFILIVLTMKYYFSYELAVDPTLAEHTEFEIAMLSTLSVFTGLFIGKLLYVIHCFSSMESTPLKKSDQ